MGSRAGEAGSRAGEAKPRAATRAARASTSTAADIAREKKKEVVEEGENVRGRSRVRRKAAAIRFFFKRACY